MVATRNKSIKKRPQKGGSSHKGGNLGPALKMAGATVAANSWFGTTANPAAGLSFMAYVFMFIILALIVWILYLIQDNLRRTPTNRIASFSPVASTQLFTGSEEPHV